MTDSVMHTKSLPEVLFRLIPTEKVRVRETNGVIQLTPVQEATNCVANLRGMFSAYPEMSVNEFLKRKHADKDLER